MVVKHIKLGQRLIEEAYCNDKSKFVHMTTKAIIATNLPIYGDYRIHGNKITDEENIIGRVINIDWKGGHLIAEVKEGSVADDARAFRVMGFATSRVGGVTRQIPIAFFGFYLDSEDARPPIPIGADT